MHTYANKLKMLALLLILTVPATTFGQGGLLGSWKYESEIGAMMMQINAGTIVINGQSYSYKAEGNYLMMNSGHNSTPYPYKLDGNKLTLEFPGGMVLVFTRITEGVTNRVEPARNQGQLSQSMTRPSGNAGQGQQTSGLSGRWVFQRAEGELVLEFLSASQLSFNGETTQYQLKEGIIQAMGDYGWINYPYKLSQGNLTVTFPDGTIVPFTKTASTAKKQQGMGQQKAGSGSNWQLKGTLCSWSGSSSSSSSYSRTQKIVFDGQGNFQSGSEASFSSNAGIAYGGNPNVKTGTYSVGERTVTLYYPDGDKYTFQVNMRQDNGMITELMYNGTLYAKGLCE
jgi:hypothetical protein